MKSRAPQTIIQTSVPRSKLLAAAVDMVVFKRLKHLSEKYLRENCPQLAIFAFDEVGLGLQLNGIYERLYLEVFMTWLTNSPYAEYRKKTVIDCGANIGNHSVFFADRFTKVVAFEPNPRTYHLLSFNTMNKENVECFMYGLSDAAGKAVLNFDSNNIGGASLHSDNNVLNLKSAPIELRALDSFKEKISNIGIIKIDSEGHELFAINGAAEIIRRDQPLILYEQLVGGIRDGTCEVNEQLRKLGYGRLYSIQKGPTVQVGILSWFFTMARRALFGQYFEVREIDLLEPRDYQLLLAVPE